ncbi:hypothetical protein [Mycobacterium colombiense]|uniref:hypothetical protein n=1 Tax=Mycobacterium colombiense TaxID=339268 RepID=UPI001E4BDAC7|nr:hypothetical protein [Mycobacterium colombiense]
MPVDPEHAEALILSYSPEIAESRRLAENARNEGRTIPLEVALASLDAEDTPASEVRQTCSDPVELGDAEEDPFPGLVQLVGADEIDRQVQQITKDVLQTAVDTRLVSLDERRVLEPKVACMNERMLKLQLGHVLKRHLLTAICGSAAGFGAIIALSPDRLLTKAVTDAALGEAATLVDSIVGGNVAAVSKRKGKLSPDLFEASMEASVIALEQSDKSLI